MALRSDQDQDLESTLKQLLHSERGFTLRGNCVLREPGQVDGIGTKRF